MLRAKRESSDDKKQLFEDCATSLKQFKTMALLAESKAELRNVEAQAAREYFRMFDELILMQKDDFYFNGRNRRPPVDNLNALLSYVYVLLTSVCCSALETVGLDPYVGFMHADKPGRITLAMDLVEELRSIYADRFVISLINLNKVNRDGFEKKKDNSIVLKEGTKRIVLDAWEKMKHTMLTHPYLKEKVEWGLIPYIQATLLSRAIRGDEKQYNPLIAR